MTREAKRPPAGEADHVRGAANEPDDSDRRPLDESGRPIGTRVRHADALLDRRGSSAWRHEYLRVIRRRGVA